MTSQLRHQLTGYVRKTDDLVVEREIEPQLFEKIRKIAAVTSDDPQAAYTYVLGSTQLQEISALTGWEFDNDRCEFFVEPA